MKKIVLVLFSLQLIVSCNNADNKGAETTEAPTGPGVDSTVTQTEVASTPTTASPSAFDLSSVPVSTADIGDFPFFTAPEGSEYINKVKPKNFDFMVFVTPDSIYEVEGKTFRAYVHPDRKSESEVSGRFLIKSYEDAIAKAGGVKVFEGRLKDERKDRYVTLCTYAGSDGSLDIWNNEIATYVIRRTDGDVNIALDKGRGNTTAIQIVQQKPFEQTIKKVTADKLEKDLAETGKSVLYINFDVDKATLKPDGLETVKVIGEMLQINKSLKVAINGYTDNSGTAARNQQLSEDRALTVKNTVIKSGIDASRLESKGYGQANPIADNGSEEGKAKNRRVELVKR
ncbi:MAG: OmpA family protein [Chitinophagaceae bacterium]|nr:MAG: OmpA family protein [Chitinophagaceae bacterium]